MRMFRHKMGQTKEVGSLIQTLDKGMVPPGVSMVSACRMWNSTQGENVVVAIMDTGIDYTHPDLKDNVIDGVSFVATEKDYMDENGHGTHISGTVAANGRLRGVAPGAKLLAVKVLNAKGMGGYVQIINGLDWARRWKGPKGEKVNVINMSLGGSLSDPYMHKAIQKTVQAGITVVCAAGNEGDGREDTEEISYPSYYPETIAVGAVDMKSGIANFSNSNSNIDVVAPGVETLSTYLNHQYCQLSGTSMAAPHVTGIVALYASRFLSRFGRYPNPAEVKQWIDFQAEDLGNIGFNDLYGYGLLTLNFDGGKQITIFPGQRIYYQNHTPGYWSQVPEISNGKLVGGIEDVAALLNCASYLQEDESLQIYK